MITLLLSAMLTQQQVSGSRHLCERPVGTAVLEIEASASQTLQVDPNEVQEFVERDLNCFTIVSKPQAGKRPDWVISISGGNIEPELPATHHGAGGVTIIPGRSHRTPVTMILTRTRDGKVFSAMLWQPTADVLGSLTNMGGKLTITVPTQGPFTAVATGVGSHATVANGSIRSRISPDAEDEATPCGTIVACDPAINAIDCKGVRATAPECVAQRRAAMGTASSSRANVQPVAAVVPTRPRYSDSPSASAMREAIGKAADSR